MGPVLSPDEGTPICVGYLLQTNSEAIRFQVVRLQLLHLSHLGHYAIFGAPQALKTLRRSA